MACAAALLSLTPLSAEQIFQPQLDIMVDGQYVILPASVITPDPNGTGWLAAGTMDVAGVDITLTAQMDPDPFLNYNYSFQNRGTTTVTLTPSFSMSVAPGHYDSAKASLSVSGVGGRTAGTIAPKPTHGYLQIAKGGSSDLGVDLGTAICNLPRFTAVNCYAVNAVSGFFDRTFSTLSLQLSFTLSPGASATVNGRVEVTAMPEPGSVLLAISGILLVFLSRFAHTRGPSNSKFHRRSR